ncbi:MAG: 1-deoxy-D-xylulose-5-phosphate reductoisomerase, partial [Oscillospiraceae bacterium]|nr:1-deoxy-D-xylulose-5-phosphate reductoisomerase [Candidatus Equicaccousia limihippi]
MKNISVLGSTGSIGVNALKIAAKHGFEVPALACNKNTDLFEKQCRRFLPKVAAMFDENAAKDLKIRLADTSVKVVGGGEGVLQAATLPQSEIVLNAVVGIAGLKPTVAAIESQKTLALANKESLVTAGDIVMKRAKEKGVKILPVDSEHSAIFQCLNSKIDSPLKKILLTASGGPFFGKTKAELLNV